jgi:hypothetical protein
MYLWSSRPLESKRKERTNVGVNTGNAQAQPWWNDRDTQDEQQCRLYVILSDPRGKAAAQYQLGNDSEELLLCNKVLPEAEDMMVVFHMHGSDVLRSHSYEKRVSTAKSYVNSHVAVHNQWCRR